MDCDGNYLKKPNGTPSPDITTSATYDMFGNKLTVTDANDIITSYEYNEIGDVTQVTYPDNTTQNITYNFENRYTTETNPDGTGSKTVCDVFGNVTDTYRLNNDGTSYDQETHTNYDYSMRVSDETNYLNAAKTEYTTTTYAYDFLGRAINTLVKDQNNNTLQDIDNIFAQAVSEDSKILNLSSASSDSGQSINNEETDETGTEYSDALGRTIMPDSEILVGADHTYTDNTSYQNYDETDEIFGDMQSHENYYYDELGKKRSTYAGVNLSIYGVQSWNSSTFVESKC